MRYRPLLGAILASCWSLPGAGAAEMHGAHHWTYSGHEGPAHWGQLDAAYATCGSGKNQSPIDIRAHEVRVGQIPSIVFRYQPSALHIVDNGHTIQVNVDPGSAVLIAGKRYELVQFHFHHPSEERVDGNGFDMVAHLVHRDSAGRLGVVAVLLRAGQKNPLIDTLWRHLPAKDHEATAKDVRINPAALLPASHAYYAYVGSLTTPPCSESVRWLVLKTPTTVSAREIATFAARYPNNARPIQRLNGRQVLASK